MPIVALVLFAVFAALGFGWRSWEQRRRTGSTGFHGVSGRPGSVEWFAGVGFIVAMAMAIFAPDPAVARRGVAVGLPARALDPDHRHRHRGDRHRRHRLRPTRHGRLVADRRRQQRDDDAGAHRRVRLGTQPDLHRNDDVRPRNRPGHTESRWRSSDSCSSSSRSRLQVRAVEEPYLLATHGDAYHDYLEQSAASYPEVGLRRSPC